MKVGIVMDSIEKINPHKDTSFAMLLEAQRRKYDCYYMELQDVWLQDGITWGRMKKISVQDTVTDWFKFGDTIEQPLVDLDLLLLRKDPPFDTNYLYLTYLLELAEAQGLRIVNRPAAVRDANEKIFAAWFPQCCPKTIVSSQMDILREFVETHEEAVIKPLHGMGGQSVFRLSLKDKNLNVILETMTNRGQSKALVQMYIPEITNGDKRILMIRGEPVPYALARIPKAGEFRANLMAGGHGVGCELNDRDYWICEQVGSTLAKKGLDFVGLDVIGDYLTEINVTSPTCARELDAQFGINIASDFFDYI